MDQKRKKTVLLIEDQEFIREMMDAILDVLGYDTFSSCDSDSAKRVAQIHGSRINAIICDIVLGGMYGPDVVEELLHLAPTAAVVFTSGYPSQDFDENEDGIFRYFLPKPFSMESMKSVLDRALSGV